MKKLKECDIVEFIEECDYSMLDNIKKGDLLMVDRINKDGEIEFVWEYRFHCSGTKRSFWYLPSQVKLVKRLL